MKMANEKHNATRMRLKAAVAALCAGLLCASAVFAVLTSTDTKINKFELAESLNVNVKEAYWDAQPDTDGDGIPDHAEGLLPTQTVAKDPAVENTSSVPAYIFADVTVPVRFVATANDDGTLNAEANTQLFAYTVNDGWTLADTIESEDGQSITYRYKYADILANDTSKTIFDQVVFANLTDRSITSDDLIQQLVVDGYAIQAEGFESVDAAYESYFGEREETPAPEIPEVKEWATLVLDANGGTHKSGNQTLLFPGRYTVTNPETGEANTRVWLPGGTGYPSDVFSPDPIKRGNLPYEREGYTFAGWIWTDEAGIEHKATLDVAGNIASGIEGQGAAEAWCVELPAASSAAEITVYAQWTPDIAEAASFAVYSADDKSLRFYSRAGAPEAGGSYEGRTATGVYAIEEPAEQINAVMMLAALDAEPDDIPTVQADVEDPQPWGSAPIDIVSVEDEMTLPFDYVANAVKSASKVDLSKLDVSSDPQYNPGILFSGCDHLRTALLGNWDINSWVDAGVLDIANMFRGCANLTTLDLSDWDVSSVVNMNGTFYGCRNLTSLNLSGWNTSNTVDMGSLFEGCSNLVSVDLSGWNTSSVTNMTRMFYGCESLTCIEEIESWDTSSVMGISSMFFNCSQIVSLNLSGWNTSNMTSMSFVFEDCSALTSLDLSGWNTSGVTNMSAVFMGCKELISLDLTGWDTSNVIKMDRMFHGCSKLSSPDLSRWNTSNVTDMSDMFEGCISFTSLDLSSFDISKVKNMTAIFATCPYLQTIYVSADWADKAVSSSNRMFQNCINLIGGNGTTYDASKLEVDYARIDDPTNGHPGYFTYKAAPASAASTYGSNQIHTVMKLQPIDVI